jgi:hypothetical protein
LPPRSFNERSWELRKGYTRAGTMPTNSRTRKRRGKPPGVGGGFSGPCPLGVGPPSEPLSFEPRVLALERKAMT